MYRFINISSFEKNMHSIMSVYCSFAIFLFSAISLIVPSGYSYGASLLLIGTITFLVYKPHVKLKKGDWLFLSIIFIYFIVSISFNFFYGLSSRSYDIPLRYLLTIPVYILLISYPPRENCFWWGIVVGSIGAGFFAFYQKFFLIIPFQRVYGFTNSIQFGDISLLMAVLSLCGLLSARKINDNRWFYYSLCASVVFGAGASLGSEARGAWAALPLVGATFLFLCGSVVRKRTLIAFTVVVSLSFSIYLLMPEPNFLSSRFYQTQLEMNNYINGKGAESSLGIRIKMWQNGVDAFMARPFVGWGDLSAIKIHFASQWAVLNSITDFKHLHNEYIDMLAKKGVLGFTALMAIYLIPLYYFFGLLRTRQKNTLAFSAAGASLILCVMAFGLTQCFLIHNNGTMAFIFYLVIIKAYCRNIVETRLQIN